MLEGGRRRRRASDWIVAAILLLAAIGLVTVLAGLVALLLLTLGLA